MTERMRFGASRGWFPNQHPEGAIADTLLSGSNVIPTGTGRLAAFPGYGSSTGTAGDTMMPVKDTSGAIGSGTIIYSRGDTYWWIGSGQAYVGSTLLDSATASLQFKIGIGGTTLTAGIPVPSQPSLVVNGAGTMTGLFSVKIAYKRSATGAVGNASLASASVLAANNSFKLTTASNVPAGIDRVRVYSCARGFSTTGPWLFLSEHTVTPGAPINITALGPNPTTPGNWADGDRGNELAPLDNFSPAALGATGTHFLVLGSVGVIIQATGGYFWSYPTKLETYSPERFATLPGPVVGVTARAADGFAFVWGTNYLAALILTPDGDVIPRLIWGHIGFPNPDAATLVESELYAWQGEPVRTTQSGDPDTSFALPVREYMRSNASWNSANTVVGYSPEWNAVVYFNGNQAVAYFRSMDAWSTPLTGLSGARAAVTVGVELRCAGTGGTLSQFGSGSGTSWNAISAFDPGVAKGFPMELRELFTTCNGAVQVDVLTNLDQGVSQFNMSVSGLGDHYSDWGHMFIPNTRSAAIKWSGTGAQVVYDTVLEYLYNRVRI